MTDTSYEINLQSKQDIICHAAKVNLQHNTFFNVHNIPFESNASIKPEKCFRHTVKKK